MTRRVGSQKSWRTKADGSFDGFTVERYDNRGNLVRYSVYNELGKFLWRDIYKYDAAGNLMKKSGQGITMLPDSHNRWAYKYDARNYLVERMQGTERTVYSNDESGNPTEETQYDSDGTILKKVSYSYEFDSRGNWIKKTPKVIQKDERLRYYYERVVYRTIDYY